MKKLRLFAYIFLIIYIVSCSGITGNAYDPNENVTIVMVGDVLLHMPVEETCKNIDGSYNLVPIFANVSSRVKNADVAIANQEVIIGGEELGISGYPCFNAPYAAGDALVNAGFDVVCHGTNHALDKGKSGLLNCYNYWKKLHPDIKVIGINGTDEDYANVDIITSKGIRIALLNYTYGTNGISMPSGMPHAVDLLEKEKVIKDLQYAEANADFTIVLPHWGTEYNLGTDKNQKYWTKIFRENGADLVIGTHPHVIEPIEMLSDEVPGFQNNKGSGDMLVYYSLGNFVSWTSSSGSGVANRSVGGLAQITIGKSAGGDCIIKSYSVEGLVCHDESTPGGVTVYPISSYTDELAARNEIKHQDSNFSRQYCVDLCNKVWGNSWN